jgi:hypothetical protein
MQRAIRAKVPEKDEAVKPRLSSSFSGSNGEKYGDRIRAPRERAAAEERTSSLAPCESSGRGPGPPRVFARV